MKLLDRHLRHAVVGVSLVVALALTGISGFITLVEELDDLGEGRYGIVQVLAVTALQLPQVAYELFPLIVLLGAVMGLGGLAAAGELVVMQAAGVSVLRIAWGAMKGGLLLGLVCLLLGDTLVPAAREQADSVKSLARFGTERSAGRSIWLRDADSYLRIGGLPSERRLRDIESFRLDPGSGRLAESLAIDEARHDGSSWRGRGMRRARIGTDSVEFEIRDAGAWPAGLRPELLRLFVLRADSLSLRGLHTYIEYLDRNALDGTAPRYAFWRKLSMPVTVLIMTLLAVPFALGPLRDTGAGQRLFAGIMVGIAFYVANEVTASLGQVYGIAAPVAAFVPTLVLGIVAVWRLQAISPGARP